MKFLAENSEKEKTEVSPEESRLLGLVYYLFLPLGNLSRLRGEIKTDNVDSLICIDKLGVISFGLYLFYGFFLRSGRP